MTCHRLVAAILVAIACLCGNPPAALAQTSPLPAASPAATPALRSSPDPLARMIAQSPAPDAGKVGLSLAFYMTVLVVLAMVAIYVTKSGWATHLLKKNVSRKLQVAEIRSLGNRQFLVVAEYEATRVLLGVSHGRIDLLCHLGRESGAEAGFEPLIDEAVRRPEKRQSP